MSNMRKWCIDLRVLGVMMLVLCFVKADALDITARGMTVRVEGYSFKIAPLERIRVDNEPVIVTSRHAAWYNQGNRVKGPFYRGGINMYGSFMPGSLTARDSTGRLLKNGIDYIISSDFGMLGLPENSSLPLGSTIYVSYEYSLQRVDAIVKDALGHIRIIRGEASLRPPTFPVLGDGERLLAHIYLQYGCDELTADNLFPVIDADPKTLSQTNPALKRLLEKMARGEKVKIICWGDSVTVGADVAKEESWYSRFCSMIRRFYPQAQIEILNYGIGSSSTNHWLKNDSTFHYLSNHFAYQKGVTYQMLLDERPDIVISEFFNDHGLSAENLSKIYSKILNDFRSIGAQWVIMSPHEGLFKYDIRKMKQPDEGVLIPFLEKFIEQNELSYVDANTRWRNLYKQGIPSFALYNNGFNHPSALGHGVFVTELTKVFTNK